MSEIVEQSAGRAVVAGLLAAVVGGAAWALIVLLTGYEVGYVAWGVGLLVGFAMARTTGIRSKRLGMVAATLAVLGLLVGKYLIIEVSLGSGLASEVQKDPQLMMQAALYRLESTSALPEHVQSGLDALAEEDTLPDGLWAQMMTAAALHLDSLDDAGREALAADFSSAVAGGLTAADKWGSAFSGFDLLWFFLAVSTAWGMMRAKHEQAAQVPAEQPKPPEEPAQP
jgi:hypothetical protein